MIITNEDLEKILATSLAINGIFPERNFETPEQLYRSIVFANSRKNSQYFAKALDNSQLKRYVTKQKKNGKALKTEIKHLDARDNAYHREQALKKLRIAGNDKIARVLCNVGLFGEGVDVPQLDAVIFMEPRKSQIDIVQAVGRVMRKAKDKKLGYIIIPIPVASNQTMHDALAKGTSGYEVIGEVISALQSHDERLAKNIAQYVMIAEMKQDMKSDEGNLTTDDEIIQGNLLNDISEVGDNIYAQIVSASGLGSAGKVITDQISCEIERVTSILMKGRSEAIDGADFIDKLAKSLGEQMNNNEKDLCKIGALLIANACILQKRLQSVDVWRESLTDMAEINLHGLDAISLLKQSWEIILEKDYKPVFEPALAVLNALPNRRYVAECIHILIECANNVADELTDLGYDHAGSLYHKIMPNAKETGAYYTNNLSALLLAKLSIKEDFVDWNNEKAIANLKIMDVACGTGTLLMASVKVMKEHFAKAHDIDLGNQTKEDREKLTNFHKLLVENVIHGLDINQCGIQLAASNLTLGAPNVDYSRMNLHTLKHGIQPDGTVKAGSLDILNDSNQRALIQIHTKHNTQLTGESVSFPTKDVDIVIMNPPFKNNVDRNSQYSAKDKKRMQQYEGDIHQNLLAKDEQAGNVIDFNSINTFFTPIIDKILSINKGVLAQVMPTTACIGISGKEQREFLVNKFHIEHIVTSHDPKNIAFSANTGIHESLMIGRRHNSITKNLSTEFISLKRMPKTSGEIEELYKAIEHKINDNRWLSRTQWSADLMKEGDWTPVQWLDGQLAKIANGIQKNEILEPLSNKYKILVGQSVRGTYQECSENDEGARELFWSISSKIRNTMLSYPESWRCPKLSKQKSAEKLWESRSNVLVSSKYDTLSGRLTACYSDTPSVGSGFIPVSPINDEVIGKGLVAWWNSTLVRLMLLNSRTKKLTYPDYSSKHLYSISIPKPDNPAWNDLYQAFEATKNKEILPLKDGENCKVRRMIDKAAAKALGISEDEVAQWRSMLAKEPTISNKYAE